MLKHTRIIEAELCGVRKLEKKTVAREKKAS